MNYHGSQHFVIQRTYQMYISVSDGNNKFVSLLIKKKMTEPIGSQPFPGRK